MPLWKRYVILTSIIHKDNKKAKIKSFSLAGIQWCVKSWYNLNCLLSTFLLGFLTNFSKVDRHLVIITNFSHSALRLPLFWGRNCHLLSPLHGFSSRKWGRLCIFYPCFGIGWHWVLECPESCSRKSAHSLFSLCSFCVCAHGKDGGDRVIAMSQGESMKWHLATWGGGVCVLMHTLSDFTKQTWSGFVHRADLQTHLCIGPRSTHV